MKKAEEDIYSSDVSEQEEETEENPYGDGVDNNVRQYTSSSSGESVLNKPTIDTFFDTESLLFSLEKTMNGFQKRQDEWVYTGKPRATSSFISSMINSLRSVINAQNMVSHIKIEEAEFILLEKNKEFIFRCYDEPSISDEDFETVINMFDHALQLFMGQVINGFGARTLRQIAANVAYEIGNPNKEKKDWLNFGFSNDGLKFGGRN